MGTAISLVVLLFIVAACVCVGCSYRQDMERHQEWDD
jgi:hypothetical protein